MLAVVTLKTIPFQNGIGFFVFMQEEIIYLGGNINFVKVQNFDKGLFIQDVFK
jgi:hypothetical protein